MRAIYLSSVFFAYIGMAVAALQQLITVPLAVSTFGESGYGLFATYFALASGIAALLGWLSTASAPMISQALHSEESARATRLYHTLKYVHALFALIIIPLALLLFYFTPLLNFDFEKNSSQIFLAALLYTVTMIATSVEPMVLFAAARADLLNKYRAISQTIVLITVVFVLLAVPNLTLLFMACALGPLLLFVFARRGLKQNAIEAFIPSQARFYSEFKPLLLSFTSLAGTNSILRTLIMLDAVFIAYIFNPKTVTIFSYYWLPANFIVLSLWKFSENAQPLFMKSFSTDRLAGGKSIYLRLRRIILLGSLFSSVLYLLLLKQFQILWVDYHDIQITSALVFAVYIVCAALYRLDFAVLYANMKFNLLLKLTIIEACIKGIGIIFLVEQFDFTCTIAAQCLAHLILIQWYAKVLVHREFTKEQLDK